MVKVIDIAKRKRIYFEMKNYERRCSFFLIAIGYMASMIIYIVQSGSELSESYHYISSMSLLLFIALGIEYSKFKRKRTR